MKGRMIRRIVGLGLCLTLAFTSLPAMTVMAYAAESTSIPVGGYIYDEQTNTYTVYNEEGLYVWNEATSAAVVNKYETHPNLTLVADITLSEGHEWKMIGYFDENGHYDTYNESCWGYNGIIDGAGHTITGLDIDDATDFSAFVGIFGFNGIVKNLTFADASIEGRTYSAVVVGYNNGGTVSDCHVEGGSLVIGTSTIGGIVGHNFNGTVWGCTNVATVKSSGSVGYFIGGIVGFNDENCAVVGCINHGNIGTDDDYQCGGVVGVNDASVIACGNTGEVYGFMAVGGIAFRNNGEIYGSWTIDTSEKTWNSNTDETEKDGIGDNGETPLKACYSGDADKINDVVDEMNEAIGDKSCFKFVAGDSTTMPLLVAHTSRECTVDDDTITIFCTVCDEAIGKAVLTAENGIYNGSAYAATLEAEGVFSSDDFTISYMKKGEENISTTAPTDAGTYIAKMEYGTTGDIKAEVEFTISKVASAITETPAANELTYTGNAQKLVTAGEAAGGTILYSLSENGTYAKEVPTATDAGEYTVWYYVKGDKNHTDSGKGSVKVVVSKVTPNIGTVTADAILDSQSVSDIILHRANTEIAGKLTVDAGQNVVVGMNELSYTFTPADTTNYNVVTGKVMVEVKESSGGVEPGGTEPDPTPDKEQETTPDPDPTPDKEQETTPDPDPTPDKEQETTPDPDPTPDNKEANTWVNDGGNWYYVDENGTKETGWVNDGGNWYYLNESGVMQTGWENVGGTWYYLNGSGAMQTGWINENGTWYYLDQSGAWVS